MLFEKQPAVLKKGKKVQPVDKTFGKQFRASYEKLRKKTMH